MAEEAEGGEGGRADVKEGAHGKTRPPTLEERLARLKAYQAVREQR